MIVRDLEFTSPDPPAVVLARLRALGAEWRMSARPAALAGTPASGIGVRLAGPAFRLTIRAWAEPHAPRLPVVCAGAVAPHGPGARLTAEVRYAGAVWAAPALAGGALLLWTAATGTVLGVLGAAVVVGGGLAGGVAATVAYHRPTTETQADAYAQALAAVAGATPGPPRPARA